MYSCFYGVAWLATTRCADLRGSVSFISSFALGFRACGVCPRGLAYDSGFCDQVKAKLVNITSKNYGFMMVFGAIIALNSYNELVYNDIHIVTYTYICMYIYIYINIITLVLGVILSHLKLLRAITVDHYIDIWVLLLGLLKLTNITLGGQQKRT